MILVTKFKNWKEDWKTSNEAVFKIFFFLNCVSFLSNKSSQRSLICKTDESVVVLGVQLVVSEETSKRALNLVQTAFPFSPALFNIHAGSYREDSLSPESLSLLCR